MYETLDRNPDRRAVRGPRRYAQLDVDAPVGRAPQPAPGHELAEMDLQRMIRWLREGWRWLALCIALGAAAALLFAALAQPRYVAYADILIDPANLQVMPGDLQAAGAQREAQLLLVESKLRMLTSTNVLRRVVESLGLTNDPEFASDDGGLPLLGWIQKEAATPQPDVTLVALRALYERVAARRDDRSFVVTLSVWSHDPDKAVTLSDAILLAFREELAQANSSTAEQAADGLVGRLDELKLKVAQAEAKVEAFRRANGLQSSSGQLLSSQTMTQLNAQLADARAQVIAAEARYKALAAVQADSDIRAASLDSPTIVALREQYAVITQQVSAQKAINGPRHPSVLGIQPQLDAVARELTREIARLVETARNDLDRTRAVVASLEEEADRIRQQLSDDDAAQIALRELEREASAQGALYEAFLARAGEISARQQIDTTNIRVISSAVPPESRSYPPRTFVLLLAGLAGGAGLGAALACGLGLARDRRRRRAA